MGFFSSLFGGGGSLSSASLSDGGKSPRNERQQSGGLTPKSNGGATAKQAELKPSEVDEIRAERRQKRLEEEAKPQVMYDANTLPISADGPVLREVEPDEANIRRASEVEEEEWVMTEDGGFAPRIEAERRRSMAIAKGEPVPPEKTESNVSSLGRVAEVASQGAGAPRSMTNKTYEWSLCSTTSSSLDGTPYRRSGDIDSGTPRKPSLTKTLDSDKTLSYRGPSVRASQGVSMNGTSRTDFGRHASSTTLAMLSNGEPLSPGFVRVRAPGGAQSQRWLCAPADVETYLGAQAVRVRRRARPLDRRLRGGGSSAARASRSR